MKKKLITFISLFFVVLLTGCFGEAFNYHPPNPFIESHLDFVKGDLETANIDWHSDKKYTKKTTNLEALAKMQKTLHYYTGQKMDLRFDYGDIRIDNITFYVKKDDKKQNCRLSITFLTCQKKKAIIFLL